MTAGVIAIVVALHYVTRRNDVLLFWIAFIFTRPFGATFGDLLTKSAEQGGLNLPRGYASLITLTLLLLVLFVSRAKEKNIDELLVLIRFAPRAASGVSSMVWVAQKRERCPLRAAAPPRLQGSRSVRCSVQLWPITSTAHWI